MKILDASIDECTIGGSSITFNDLEERLLDMAEHVASGTLISHHSKEAIHSAFTKGWIESSEKGRLLTVAHFCSPDCAKAQQVSGWLRRMRTPTGSSASHPRARGPAEPDGTKRQATSAGTCTSEAIRPVRGSQPALLWTFTKAPLDLYIILACLCPLKFVVLYCICCNTFYWGRASGFTFQSFPRYSLAS